MTLSPEQHGFRKGRGTDTAIYSTLEWIGRKISRPERKVHVVMRDVSKAFDRVWHDGLLFKFQEDELPSNLQRAMGEFLRGRKLVIRGRDVWIPVQAGVPQGSVLSPTLYNYYLKDLPRSKDGWKCVYADDVTQVIDHEGWYNAKKRYMRSEAGRSGIPYPQEEIERGVTFNAMSEVWAVDDYERKWKIKTNRAKFQVIPLHVHKQRVYTMMGGDPVNGVKDASFLGVHLGTWNLTRHAYRRLSMAKKALTDLQTLGPFLPEELKLRLIETIVRPTLLYPPICFENPGSTLGKSLEVLERRCVRFVVGRDLRDRDTKEVLLGHQQRLGLEPFQETVRKWSNGIRQRMQDDPELLEQLQRARWSFDRKKGYPGALEPAAASMANGKDGNDSSGDFSGDEETQLDPVG